MTAILPSVSRCAVALGVLAACLAPRGAAADSPEVQLAADRAEEQFIAGPDRSRAVRLFTVRITAGTPRGRDAVMRVRNRPDVGGLRVEYALAGAAQGFHHAYRLLAARAPDRFGPGRAPGIAVQEWSADASGCAGLEGLVASVAAGAEAAADLAFESLAQQRPAPWERLVLHGDEYGFHASAGNAGGELSVSDTDGSALAGASQALRDRVVECAGREPTRRYEVGAATALPDDRAAQGPG